MRLTLEAAETCGKLADKMSWTDEELDMLIKAQEFVVRFLEPRGLRWMLALNPLRSQLELLKNFKLERKR